MSRKETQTCVHCGRVFRIHEAEIIRTCQRCRDEGHSNSFPAGCDICNADGNFDAIEYDETISEPPRV